MQVNQITGSIVDSAMKVYSALRPGLLEKTYEVCLAYELKKRGLQAEAQVELPVTYDNLRMEVGYRVDLLVERMVIVEVKAVEDLHPVHQTQLLTYFKLSDKRIGLLINFNVAHLRDGIKRIVYDG